MGTQERLPGGMQGCQRALLDLALLLPLGTLLPFPGAPAQTWKEGCCIRWVRLQFWEETQRGHLAVVVTQKQQQRWHLGQLQGLLQVSWVSAHMIPTSSYILFPLLVALGDAVRIYHTC